MPRFRTAVVVLSGLLVATTLGVTNTPGGTPAQAAPAQASDPPAPKIPKRYLNQPIKWKTCAFDGQVKQIYAKAPTTRCATVKAPMDWHAPNAHPDIELRIAYSEATGKSKGLMASNPGGPGGAGLTLSAALAADKPKLFKQYDLLGFDPRGFGKSEPLRCLTTAGELENLPTTPDYRERDHQTHQTEVAEARLLSEACSATEFGQFASSQQTVYDMDFLRALMGARQTNFIGYSYGTWLGGWYADTYPERVGRFVLDSNMDWTHTQWQNQNFDPFSFQRRRDMQLFPWIARHHDQIDGLGRTPERVLQRYERIRADVVELQPSGDGSVRGDGLDSAVAGAIYSNRAFVGATLSVLVHDEFTADPADAITQKHIKRAVARLAPPLRKYVDLAEVREQYGVGDVKPTGTDALDRARARAADQADDEVVDLGAIGTTVRCNDTEYRENPWYYLHEADRMTAKYPFVGYLNGVSMCAFWPHEPQDREIDLSGSARVLMITGEVDPATAYEGALRTHEDTAAATRLVSIDDEGQHGQYVGSYSRCAERIGDRFVFRGEAPGKDRVCGTSPLPEDSAVYPVDGPVDGNSVPLPEWRVAYQPDEPNPMLQRIIGRVAQAGVAR